MVAVVPTMLMMAQEEYRYTQDWMAKDKSYTTVYFNYENISAGPAHKTINSAVAALPDIPKVEDVWSEADKERAVRSVYQPYKMSIEQTMLLAENRDATIRARMSSAHQKQAQRGQQAMQQYQSNVNAGLMPSQQEMMELYMSGAIKDNMSEAQMMDVMAGKFAAKWGVSKEEYLKIIGMAQSNPKQAEAYLKSNHPDLYKRLYAANAGYDTHEVADDPRDKRFGEIMEELNSLMQQLQGVVKEYGTFEMRNGSALQGNYDVLHDQLAAEWSKSAEAAQIDAIEEALQKRVESWYTTLKYDTFADVPYPGWWTEERKKENALIDQWNRRSAEKWLAIAAKYQDRYKTIFKQVGALELENEQLNEQGAQDNILYLENLHQINVMYGMLVQLVMPMQDAFSFPCIEHVETSGSAHLGKG